MEGAAQTAEAEWMRVVREGTEEEIVWQCSNLLHWLRPTPEAEERRTMVFCHMRDVLRRHGTGLESAEVFLTGSFPIKTYLPDADIDLTLLLPQTSHTNHTDTEAREGSGSDADNEVYNEWVLKVNNALCQAALLDAEASSATAAAAAVSTAALSSTASRSAQQSARGGGSATRTLTPNQKAIRNVTFINGRVKIVNCLVGNIAVDMTAGQSSSLGAVALLEEADRMVIGQNHLLKRSLLLIKAWCMYESGAHAASVGAEPIPILNSRAGRLSSYALSVMVLWLFNNDPETIAFHDRLISGGVEVPENEGLRRWGQDRPLDDPIFVLLRFLQVYSAFDWENHVLSIEGTAQMPPAGSVEDGDSSPNQGSSGTSNGSTDGLNFSGQGSSRFTPVLSMLRSTLGNHTNGKVEVTSSDKGRRGDSPPLLSESPPSGLSDSMSSNGLDHLSTDSRQRSLSRSRSSLPIRHKGCNIVDPLNASNNLGFGIKPDVLQQITSTIAHGSKHFEGLLSWHYGLKCTAMRNGSNNGSSNGSKSANDHDHAVNPGRTAAGGGGAGSAGANGASHGGIPKDPSLAGRHRSNTDPDTTEANGKQGRPLAHDSATASQLEHVQNDKMWFLRAFFPTSLQYYGADSIGGEGTEEATTKTRRRRRNSKGSARDASPDTAGGGGINTSGPNAQGCSMRKRPLIKGNGFRSDMLDHPCQEWVPGQGHGHNHGRHSRDERDEGKVLSGDTNAIWKSLSRSAALRNPSGSRTSSPLLEPSSMPANGSEGGSRAASPFNSPAPVRIASPAPPANYSLTSAAGTTTVTAAVKAASITTPTPMPTRMATASSASTSAGAGGVRDPVPTASPLLSGQALVPPSPMSSPLPPNLLAGQAWSPATDRHEESTGAASPSSATNDDEGNRENLDPTEAAHAYANMMEGYANGPAGRGAGAGAGASTGVTSGGTAKAGKPRRRRAKSSGAGNQGPSASYPGEPSSPVPSTSVGAAPHPPALLPRSSSPSSTTTVSTAGKGAESTAAHDVGASVETTDETTAARAAAKAAANALAEAREQVQIERQRANVANRRQWLSGLVTVLVVFLWVLASGGRSRLSDGAGDFGVDGDSRGKRKDAISMGVPPPRLSMDPLKSLSDKDGRATVTASTHGEVASLEGKVPNSSLSSNAYGTTGAASGRSTAIMGSTLNRLDVVNQRRLEAAAATLGPATHWVLLNESMSIGIEPDKAARAAEALASAEGAFETEAAPTGTGGSASGVPEQPDGLVGESATAPSTKQAATAAVEYQWQKDGEDIPGETHSYFSILNATMQHEGTYVCVVTFPLLRAIPARDEVDGVREAELGVDGVAFGETGGEAGVSVSSQATRGGDVVDIGDSGVPSSSEGAPYSIRWGETVVRIAEAPVVTNYHGKNDVMEGASLVLMATARGVPQLDYQWVFNGMPIEGAKTKILELHNIQKAQAGTYTCFVENIAGKAVWMEAFVNVRTKGDTD